MMRVLYEICSKKMWKACEFSGFTSYFFHSTSILIWADCYLSEAESGAACVQVVLCDEHWEGGRSINKANRYRAEVNLKLLLLSHFSRVPLCATP